MNAVEFIKENANFLDLLNHYGAKHINDSGQYIRSACPIHQGNNITAFVYNKSSKLWYCHTACDTGGDIISLVMQMEQLAFKDAINRIAELLHLDITNMEILEQTTAQQKEIRSWLEYMRRKKEQKTNRVFDITELGYTSLKPIIKYRHFTKQTLEQYECYLADKIIVPKPERTFTLTNRLIVPIYHNFLLIGATCRKLDANAFGSKWTHLPEGFDSGSTLYNIDSVTKHNAIYIVEGPFDVWNMTQLGIDNVVAAFGSHLTSEQIKILQTHTFDLILAFDKDSAGVLATLNVLEQIKSKFNVKVMMWNSDVDPGELTANDFITIRYLKPYEFVAEFSEGYENTKGKWRLKRSG